MLQSFKVLVKLKITAEVKRYQILERKQSLYSDKCLVTSSILRLKVHEESYQLFLSGIRVQING